MRRLVWMWRRWKREPLRHQNTKRTGQASAVKPGLFLCTAGSEEGVSQPDLVIEYTACWSPNVWRTTEATLSVAKPEPQDLGRNW